MRKVLIFIICAFVLTLSSVSVLAQEDNQTNESVNSFELFWPVVAGKSKGDTLYSLKLFKEKVRGFLIFGKPQKADYSLFLTTKRVLEAEKLSKEGKKDYSVQTFDMALSQLAVVEKSIEDSGDNMKSTVDDLNLKFDNLEVFLPWLVPQYKDQELTSKAQQVLDKVVELHNKI